MEIYQIVSLMNIGIKIRKIFLAIKQSMEKVTHHEQVGLS